MGCLPPASRADLLTFGTWQIGGARFGYIGNDEALALVRYAVSAGIGQFDTSNVYGNGRGQVLLGHVMGERPRERFRVTAKLGYVTGFDGFQDVIGDLPQAFSPDRLRVGLEETLTRLRTDYVDDLLLHDAPSSVLQRDDVWRTLRSFIDEGLARAIGVSTVPKKVAMAIARGATCVQIPVFVGQQMPGLAEALAASDSHGIRVMARSVLQGGRLLNGYPSAALPDRISTLFNHAWGQPGVRTAVVGFTAAAEIRQLLSLADVFGRGDGRLDGSG